MGNSQFGRNRGIPPTPPQPGDHRAFRPPPSSGIFGESNKLGWILAAAFVVLLVVFIIVKFTWESHSDPSMEIADKELMRFHDVSIPLSQIIGTEPGGSGNAGDDYRKAIDLANAFLDKAKASGNADFLGNPANIEDLKAIDAAVAAGAAKREMTYLLVHTPREIPYALNLASADEFIQPLGALTMLADYHIKRKEYDQAQAVLSHAFMMGRHMLQERSHPDMSLRGIGVQTEAIRYMRQICRANNDVGRDRTLQQYLDQLDILSNTYTRKKQRLWKLDATRGGIAYPGDIFWVVEHDEDRACRVDGLLALGAAKFASAGSGDRKYAAKLLDQYAASKDLVLAAAATAGRKMTREDLRTIVAQ